MPGAHQCGGTTRNRIACVVVTVMIESGNAEEHVAWTRPVGSVRDAADARVRSGIDCRIRSHQKL
jgi:hypothetical protein